MKPSKRYVRLAVTWTAAVAIVVAVAIGAAGGPSQAPGKTPYQIQNGQPDLDSLPTRVPIAGPKGNQIASVPRECLFGAPDGVDCSALPVADDANVSTETFGPDEVP